MIKAIIVDDEKPTLVRLQKQIEESGMAQTIGIFTKADEALEFLKSNVVDVAFLDIEMPGINGLELASCINNMQPYASIIFITAYNQYALEAFRLNAIDYLLKPMTLELLRESLSRVKKEIKPNINGEYLSMKCFGKFTVLAKDEEIIFRTEKTKELLAFLIAQNGVFVSRDIILDSLWEDFDGDRALVNFNTTLYNLRKSLLSFQNNISIIYESNCYRLHAKNICCDYLDFCQAAEKKEIITKENHVEYEKILSLYSGEFLAGLSTLWVVQKKIHTADFYIDLLIKIANFYLNHGDRKKVYKLLNDGLEKEPLNRNLNYFLIKLLLADNERMKAEIYYNAYKEALNRQLKETPDEELKLLMKIKNIK